jgi:aerobic carbon-monoxide dehydrogenase small subunit
VAVTTDETEVLPVTLDVNGKRRTETVEARLLLVDFLRDVLGLTGTHIGCDTSTCGACTVLLDGRSVKSCTMFAAQASGSAVRTVEGLAANGELHPVQRAFHECHALQCGYCTPGMLLSAVTLLERNPAPHRAEITRAIAGNLCRCTGYAPIVDAIELAARRLVEGSGR